MPSEPPPGPTEPSAPSAPPEALEPMVGTHVVQFPGGYTRSTGPVIGRFLTELRDGRVLGLRTPAGRVLFPPTEYDPDDGAPAVEEGAGGDWREVGPAGTVRDWCWVGAPRPGHPFDHPFAWATVLLDGADTPFVHALSFGPEAAADRAPRELAAGLRVRLRLRPDQERTGSITDIRCLRPEVTRITDPHRLEYTVRADAALTRYLQAQFEGRILGSKMEGGHIYVPLRDFDPTTGRPALGDVELPDTGVLTTFSVNHVPDPRAPRVPFVTGYVRLDGADVDLLALLGDVEPEDVHAGMRVRAQWLPPGERTRGRPGIRWFVPEGGGR